MRTALLLIVLAASAQASALGIRCGNRVINDGMLEPQVRNACGAPFWADDFVSVEIIGAGGPIERQREVSWDVWYYNFGPSKLMQRMTFRDGQLQSVEALGYGYAEIGTACVPAIAARGISAGELVARCGEPASRRRNDGALVQRAAGLVHVDEDRSEEWLYDDGSGHLTRFFIANGTVTGFERRAD